jgi:hypothetical protein
MSGREPNRDEEIRQLAYKLWQEAGCPEGSDVQNWLNAEAIWLEQQQVETPRKPVRPPRARRPRKARSTLQEL